MEIIIVQNPSGGIGGTVHKNNDGADDTRAVMVMYV
jgi:hypothetical protein